MTKWSLCVHSVVTKDVNDTQCTETLATKQYYDTQCTETLATKQYYDYGKTNTWEQHNKAGAGVLEFYLQNEHTLYEKV